MLLYSTSFISMTSFTLYPHSYSIIPSIHHQNIHRIHLNNSYHHHYLIYLVSRSTHLGTRSPLYIILYSTSFISMTSFTLYPHSYSIIPSIHHQNIHRIHLNNSYHHHYIIYLVSRSTHLGTRSPLYLLLYSTSFISMTSFTLYPHSYSVIPCHSSFIKTFTAFTWITLIITIISFILFQDLHILEQDLHSISYFIQHHSFQWLLIIQQGYSFTKHSPHSMTSFLEQNFHSISYFTLIQYHFHPFINQNIHRIHLNNSVSSPLSHLSCFKIYTSWNKISTLYPTLFNIIHFNDIIHSISTLIQYHSIHSSPKHSPHSPE